MNVFPLICNLVSFWKLSFKASILSNSPKDNTYNFENFPLIMSIFSVYLFTITSLEILLVIFSSVHLLNISICPNLWIFSIAFDKFTLAVHIIVIYYFINTKLYFFIKKNPFILYLNNHLYFYIICLLCITLLD